MEFEWDPAKADANRRKHGVDFTDAVFVLHDDLAVTVEDTSGNEARFVTVGVDALGRLLVVAYTWRGEVIRLMSARKATPRERRDYEREP